MVGPRLIVVLGLGFAATVPRAAVAAAPRAPQATPEAASPPAPPARQAADGTPWREPDLGLRLTVPAGWTVSERGTGSDSLRVTLEPPGAGGTAQLVLMTNPSSAPDPAAMQAAAVTAIEAADGYDNPRRMTRHVAGQDLPGVMADVSLGSYRLVLRQAFLVHDGMPLVLQDHALAADIEQRFAQFDATWDTLDLQPPSAARRERLALLSLAARCGSEAGFASGWDDAATRARAEHKFVLVAARMYPGFAISDERLSGPFMDEEILDLIHAACVPLLLAKGDPSPLSDPARYGFGSHAFGETVLLVTPEGQVLAEARNLTDDFLREALAAHPPEALADGVPDASGPPPERAAALARRGAVDEALEVLSGAGASDTVEDRLLRARLHRRLRQGEAALADIAAARGLPRAADFAADADLEQAGALAGLGRAAEARECLDALLAGRPQSPRAAEALLARAQLERELSGCEAAEALFRRVIAEHGDTRWAWIAAATLTGSGWELKQRGTSRWPDEDAYGELARPRYAPLPPEGAREARDGALAWLLANQQADGSWFVLEQAGRAEGAPPGDFKLSSLGLAVAALVPHRDEPGVAPALARAVAALRSGTEAARAEPAGPRFMDYSVWSRAILLLAVSALVEPGGQPRDDWAPFVTGLCDDLAADEKPGGGWSYYVTGDVTAGSAGLDQAMSFTTAAVVRGLLAARDAGFAVPEALARRGLDCIERARRDDSYTYMVAPAGKPANAVLPAGDAARGPACALALFHGGRAEAGELSRALRQFERHRAGFASELGKSLLHTGPEAEGSHYLLFDWMHALLAVAEAAEPDARAKHAWALEELLRARTPDGAFIDFAVNGRAAGTAMALIGLDAWLAPPTR